jgi:hypothetical protein
MEYLGQAPTDPYRELLKTSILEVFVPYTLTSNLYTSSAD